MLGVDGGGRGGSAERGGDCEGETRLVGKRLVRGEWEL